MNSVPSSGAAHSEPVKFDLWRRIYSRLGPYWKAAIVAAILLSISAATQPTLAVIMKPLLDEGFGGSQPSLIWSIPLAVVGLMLLRGICTFGSSYVLAWIANNMLLGIRREMFERLLGLPDEEFRRGDTGRLLNRFTIDANNVTNLATEVITVLVRETLIVVALLAVLLYMSWQLTLIVVVMLPLSVFVSRIFIKRLRRINRDTISMNAELTRVVGEAIDGQRVVKLFDGYERESGRFQYVNGRLRRFAMRAVSADAAMSPLTQFFVALSVAAVIAVALYQANHGGLTVGSFAAFMAALGQIFDPLKRLTNIAAAMQRMLVSAESVFALVDHLPEDDSGTFEFTEPVKGKVEFRNIVHRFAEAQSDTISDVSFTVEPGQTVALVGRSGSGKTTLVNMLPRFIVPTSGQVLIDGHPVLDCTLRSLRAQLSLVSQDVVLFDGTIGENVGYGALHQASQDDIHQALEAANLHHFVADLPQGLETQVGENANTLSGGQRQRLAIARALIKNAPILILDEATSALDNESEAQVQASLERLMAGRTTLVIAHRLSTVQKADKIVVLDAGRIVEQGRHEDLLASDGLYASLYNMQFKD
ncbi:lipid A export permease/ATP-binding protein MsbA [Eoetvoesiella caeni]|uniref:Subfamily B ATP-binding cassette protein MsbA n=1 Tax=Eoetvoesiella caeni TaxID=645616 RepID=A0A366H7Y1_9BURK|nr:lipid A export permease/ATP-binding protein MsbA [Eoetvoesiella caeni]MCI2810074.1 lipid A export permease/ATP-binding protein MsbA [Eoetvoesiella caeni]NYT55945.1 lipid A export permease/ATP-binding protein MsbA [Eoetvoesiella caeni]RBP37442.1 subfamily B ATP-binding cassette protein MsbA [Eoetvoesiella caeni]